MRPVIVNCVCFNSYSLNEAKSVSSGPSMRVKSFGKVKSLPLRHVLALVDQRGYLFVFDFGANSYSLVSRIGVSATCMQFLCDRPREVLVGLSGGGLQCYNVHTHQMVAKLPTYHKSAPLGISTHPFLPLALTYCSTLPILWNTAKWERKSILVGAEDSAVIRQASFSPNGRLILATFSDGTLFIWNSETCELDWKLSLQVPVGDTHFRFNYFAVSNDSSLIAFSGATNSSIFVWNLPEKRLLHEIVVPTFKGNRTVVQINFIGATSAVSAVCSTGEVVLLDAAQAKYLGQLANGYSAHYTAPSRDGSLLAFINAESRSNVVLVATNALVDELVPLTDSMAELTRGFELSTLDTEASSERPAKPKSLRFEAAKRDLSLNPCETKTLYDIVEERQGRISLMGPRLAKYLAHFRSYPNEYRTLIWRFLLRTPENRDAYESLMDRGINPSLKHFRKEYPLKSERLLKSMERTLSALSYWSPIFEQVSYLPQLIFPFVKLFLNDQFSGFEVIATTLLNWCQKWWEYFPNPPIEVLDVVEDVLTFHDPALMQHLLDNKITSAIYAWIPLQTFFSEQFPAHDWLVFADHIFTKRFGKVGGPGYLYGVVVAYIIYHRKALLRVTKEDDFRFFFSRPAPTSIHKLLNLAEAILSKTPGKLDPNSFLSPFTPLPRGDYPVFNAYPRHIVNFNNKLRQQIQKDEAAYLLKKTLASNLTELERELAPEPVPSFDELRRWYENVYHSHSDAAATHDAQANEAQLEAEWLQKRDELLLARRNLRELEKRRVDNLLGVFKQDEVDSGLARAKSLRRTLMKPNT